MNSIRKQYNKRISPHRPGNIRTYLLFSQVRRDEAVSGNCIFACTMAQKVDAVTHAQVSRSLCLDLTSRTVYLCTDFYHQRYVADACGALYLEFCLPHGHTRTPVISAAFLQFGRGGAATHRREGCSCTHHRNHKEAYVELSLILILETDHCGRPRDGHCHTQLRLGTLTMDGVESLHFLLYIIGSKDRMCV